MASTGLRLVILTTSYPLSESSVSGVFVQRLIEHMPLQNNIVVVTPASSTPHPTQALGRAEVKYFRYAPMRWQILAHSPGGIPVALKQNRWLYLLLPFFLTSMAWHIAKYGRQADIVHANWAICGAVAGMMGAIYGFPVVTTLRGEDIARVRNSKIDKFLLWICLRLSSKVVGVSQAIVDWLKKCHPTEVDKVSLIPNGVDNTLFDLPRSVNQAAIEKPLNLITVGSLIPRKGVDTIIRAIAETKGNYPFLLTIVGDGPERSNLEKLSRELHLESKVIFYGEAAPSAIAGILGGADIFVLASYSEGRPNALLEAMAAGLPTISSDIEGVRELVKHGQTGLLFPAGSATCLARQLESLSPDGNMRFLMGQSGRETLRKAGLFWSESARHYDGLYRAVAIGNLTCAD